MERSLSIRVMPPIIYIAASIISSWQKGAKVYETVTPRDSSPVTGINLFQPSEGKKRKKWRSRLKTKKEKKRGEVWTYLQKSRAERVVGALETGSNWISGRSSVSFLRYSFPGPAWFTRILRKARNPWQWTLDRIYPYSSRQHYHITWFGEGRGTVVG